MATIVQSNCDVEGNTTSSFDVAFTVTPTSGNLLVLFYGARDDDDSGTPTFSMPSGWTKVAETSPMEFHACGIAFKTSTGDEATVTVTPGEAVNSAWIGVVEFNESGVSSWALDQASADGSGATNVASIDSGTTGTLGSAVGVAAVAGTSRTGGEGLSTDTGTSLDAEHTNFQIDAGAANFIAAWLSLTSTDALNATISESNGSSRMGAAIATFIEAASASPTAFFDITDLPADFGNAETATITVRTRGVDIGATPLKLFAQLFQSDETTTLSDEVEVASHSSDSSFANSAAVTFTGLNTTADKSVWDNARVRFRWGT